MCSSYARTGGSGYNKFVGLCALEVLHVAFVFLSGCAGFERAEIAALAGFGILLARVEAIFAGLEFADHGARKTSNDRGAFLSSPFFTGEVAFAQRMTKGRPCARPPPQ